MKIPLRRRHDELEGDADFLRYRRRSRPAAKPRRRRDRIRQPGPRARTQPAGLRCRRAGDRGLAPRRRVVGAGAGRGPGRPPGGDRKSTRLNSSHGYISYAVFCLKKKKNTIKTVIGSEQYVISSTMIYSAS